jgi:hypothetical protein
MTEPERESPPSVDSIRADTAPATAAYLPFGAYELPSVLVATRPAWTHTYELPTARSVVSAGLQLALASTVPIRRASIYIGLLSLGAFGPAAILLLVGLARLLGDPVTAAVLKSDDPTQLFLEQPALAGPLTLIYAVGIVGLILIVAISIDAKAIAIAMLGGTAAENPVTLPEAIARARQTFWRLLGSGLLVGVVSTAISLVLAWPFLRPFDSNQGVTFITSMIGTLVVTPYAYASAGIVLGDAGAIDTLRRSMALFRARPRVALVVTLFTLVSAAIQTFALSGGADLAYRVATFFHIGQGAGSLILPGILVLAFIVAFGSLTCTIAAIVAAPQVAAFLGLTFYSAGLDRARAVSATPARRIRWVTVPMTVVMVGLALVAVFGVGSINGFRPQAPSPATSFLRDAAAEQGASTTALGVNTGLEDEAGDVRGPASGPWLDILEGDEAWLPQVPGWLLDSRFRCGDPHVSCPTSGSNVYGFNRGAVLFVERLAAGPDALAGGGSAEWGPIFTGPDGMPGDDPSNPQFAGATHAVLTRLRNGGSQVIMLRSANGVFTEIRTDARSVWMGATLVTIVPIGDLQDVPTTWDVYGGERGLTNAASSRDTLRPDDRELLQTFVGIPILVIGPGSS